MTSSLWEVSDAVEDRIKDTLEKPVFGCEARIDAEDFTKKRAELAAPIRLARQHGFSRK